MAEIQEIAFSEIQKIIHDLGTELHWSDTRLLGIREDTHLDRDLGLDSLSRVELFGRIERRLGVYLGESVYLSVETVRDIIAAVKKAKFGRDIQVSSGPIAQPFDRGDNKTNGGLPIDAETLNDVIKFHADHHGARTHMIIHEPGRIDSGMSYAELYRASLDIASGLRASGVTKGESVAIMLPTCRDYFFVFFGSLLAGAIPVPIYPPSRPSQLEDHLKRHAEILRNCHASILITTSQMARGLAQLLRLKAIHLRSIVSPDELKGKNPSSAEACQGGDLAFLQYTSGSTGTPKGVILTHNNLLSNIRVMGETICATSRDVFVSWLPLYHDMGLIGAWLGSLYFGNLLVVMSPFSFLSQPKRWLDVIQNYGGTITAAPNFAYELCLKHIPDEIANKMNLKSLRVMFNGAEAVLPETVERFTERFSNSGLKREALMPVYGLAESSVGLAFPPLGRGPRIDAVDRESFLNSGRARVASIGANRPMRFVACGKPLAGHEIRIVDIADQEIAERQEGRIQFRGPSCTSGYMEQPEQNQKLFHGPWLDSGDLGYVAEGDLFVTGRVKDMIKHAGRNIHPEELEALVGSLEGVRKGCVAVFGSTDKDLGTEKLVVVAETRSDEESRRELMKKLINQTIGSLMGAAPDEVIIAPPHTILKTSSGKIRRSATKRLYETGSLVPGAFKVNFEIMRYIISTSAGHMAEWAKSIATIGKSIFAWTLGTVIPILVWPIFMLYPTLKGRWAIAKALARMVLLISGVRIIREGLENIQHDPCIYVSNHSSYADVVVLCSVLPTPVSFVAKAELGRARWLRLTLERIGVVFVERYDLKKTLIDTRELTARGREGQTLLTFPEGTFTRRQGLIPFHLGAFMMAVETGMPLAPISIRGTRSILHPDSWIIRSGNVYVRFLPRITCSSIKDSTDPWKSALQLRDMARGEILKYCGEADLAQ